MSTLFISPARSRQVIAAIVAFALVSVFVIRTSDAAFTATAQNTGNEFSTGSISLDEDFATPLFGDDDARKYALELVPGQSVESCIEITYAGDVGSENLTPVELNINIGNDSALSGHLDVDIATAATCGDAGTALTAGTLADLSGLVTTGWTPDAPAETLAFNFAVTVNESFDGEGAQGLSVSDVDLIWSVTTASS